MLYEERKRIRQQDTDYCYAWLVFWGGRVHTLDTFAFCFCSVSLAPGGSLPHTHTHIQKAT